MCLSVARLAELTRKLGLEVRSTQTCWSFSRRGQKDLVFTVHAIGKTDGSQSFKCTCKAHSRGKKRCVCWITKFAVGEVRWELFQALVKWGAAAEASDEQQHAALSSELKKSFGMKVRS